MKRLFYCSLLVMLIALCCASVQAESVDYWLDLPDEITVGSGETVTATFRVPGQYVSPNSVYIVCDTDYEAMTGWASSRETTDTYADLDVSFKFSKKGDFRFHVQHGAYIRYIDVHVEDLAKVATVRQVYAVAVGETVEIEYTTTDGALYNTCRLGRYDYWSGGISIDSDAMTVTGNIIGSYVAYLSAGGRTLCEFTVLVVEPSQNVTLNPAYDQACVGLEFDLPVLDGSGKTVCALVEITEGGDCAELYYNTNNNKTICRLKPVAPGWITISAYGTDGSTDSVRMRIYTKPTSSNVVIPSTSLAAGESMQISIDYPEDSWYPVSMGLSSHTPASRGLTGPVATLENGVLTALMPGTCELSVGGVSPIENYIVNITDSDQALTIIRPEYGFYWREPFQMSVRTKAGQVIPAEFSITASHISVTEDGLLTADGPGQGTAHVSLENGLSYEFIVNSVDAPSWLRYSDDSATIRLNEDLIISSLDSDIGSLDSNKWVMCSNDESIIRCDGQRIYPVSIGSTSVTVWSRYNDVSCEIPVTVTAPSNALYINGSETGDLYVPVDSDPVKLPTVTDYYGNTVKVTWEKTYDDPGVGNPKTFSVSLNKTRGTVTANWARGNAVLIGTSASGATIRLYITPYTRSTSAYFENTEYNIHIGERAQVEFHADPSTNAATLESQDVTFSFSGDTDCVEVAEASFSYHTLIGLKPGTVTLTAKLWNGKTYTATIKVTEYAPCASGHSTSWRVTGPVGLIRDGAKEQYCTRCGLVLKTEVIPCTGVLSFSETEFFVSTSGDTQTVSLGTAINGDRKHSFTWRSSDDTIAKVEAGRVTGLKAGTAYIIAFCGDCEPAVCTVHVVDDSRVSVLRLPRSLREIGDSAFEGMAATHAVVPQGVTSIDARAFADCPALRLVIIPASVTQIADTAFAGSAQVTFQCPAGSYAEQFAQAHNIPLAE